MTPGGDIEKDNGFIGGGSANVEGWGG